MMMRLLTGLVLTGVMYGLVVLIANDATVMAQEKKKEKDPREGKKGTIIGILTAKEKNTIEVKADGEETARKYFPQWKGGNPDKGGGPDKDMLKIFSELKVGSRVEVEWLYEERLRVLKVKVLKLPKEKEKDSK